MLPFIENSFKHGISYREKSFIHINIEQKNNEIILECRNSIPANSFNDKPVGVGLKNVRKRLDLLFNSKYTLNITDNNKEFVVNLILPVNEA
jgi:sensor histidine kinase YesM